MKFRVLSASDGARQFMGFMDTQINEPCFFQAAGDGRQYCLPTTALYMSKQYADSACTRLIGWANGPDCLPSFARMNDTAGCTTTVRVFRVGPPFPGDAQAYFRNSDGECVETNLNRDFLWFQAGVEVPLSDFVSGSMAVQ